MTDVIDQNGWGVCGVVGVLNALHQSGKLETFEKNLTVDQIHGRLAAEILTYLKLTKVEKPALGDDILQFTQSFGKPYSEYEDLDDVIDRFKLTYYGVRPKKLGVALTMDAIIDYARSAGLKAEVEVLKSKAYDKANLLNLSGCIVGLGDGRDISNQWHGLKHWVYVTPQGHLLNWGLDIDLRTSSPMPTEFKSVTGAIRLF